MRNRLAIFAAALVSVLAPAVPGAGAATSGGDNIVQVVNRLSDGEMTRARTAVTEVSGSTVDNRNTAVAYASCTDCRTVAVAVQVVVLEDPVSDFRPANAAVAVNAECTRCQTFAYARQEVLSAGREFDLSDAGAARILELRSAIRGVAASGAAFEEMIAELDRLSLELVEAVRTESERSGAETFRRTSRRNVDED